MARDESGIPNKMRKVYRRLQRWRSSHASSGGQYEDPPQPPFRASAHALSGPAQHATQPTVTAWIHSCPSTRHLTPGT